MRLKVAQQTTAQQTPQPSDRQRAAVVIMKERVYILRVCPGTAFKNYNDLRSPQVLLGFLLTSFYEDKYIDNIYIAHSYSNFDYVIPH